MITTSRHAGSRGILVFFALMMSISLTGCVSAVVGVGAAAVTAGTTEKGLGTSIADSVIKVKIADDYLKTNADLFSNVTVTVNDGSVLLTGNVNLPEEKIQATQIAWQSRGVIEVINELDVKDTSTVKDIAKDLAAAAQLRAKMIADQDISSINFSVDVVNGTVFLSGIASSEDEANQVVEHARSLRFATDVKNYIRINDDDRE
ncbi:MAG: BON domain-containing protein [Alphaproteobacteria bacterium]|nr:BON domain-containing protein [Alphaproteobacteria bacterium]